MKAVSKSENPARARAARPRTGHVARGSWRAGASVLLVACRWGGPEGDPGALHGDDASPVIISVPNGSAPGASAGSPQNDRTNVPPDAANPSDTTGAADESAAGATSSADGVLQEDGVLGIAEGADSDAGAVEPPELAEPAERCTAPAGLLCDPVSGAGCPPLTQCVVDPNASAAAAYCVLGGVALGAACTQDPLSTSCPPQRTCVEGQCRRYCYCDSDCDDGDACTQPSRQGPSDAFRLCAAATP